MKLETRTRTSKETNIRTNIYNESWELEMHGNVLGVSGMIGDVFEIDVMHIFAYYALELLGKKVSDQEW